MILLHHEPSCLLGVYQVLPQLMVCGALQQVFLAMPSACPVAPDGSKRSVPTGADDRGAVTMYTSDDNAETFKQVNGPCELSSCSYDFCQGIWAKTAVQLRRICL